MARKYKSTVGSRKHAAYSSETLEKALKAITTGALTQRQAAAVSYNIPRSTLKNKLKGAHPNKFGVSSTSSDKDQSHTDTPVAHKSASTTGTSQLLAVNEDDDLDLECQSESDYATINHESRLDTDVEHDSDSEPLIAYVGTETGPRSKQIPVALEEDCYVIVEYEDQLYPGQVPYQ